MSAARYPCLNCLTDNCLALKLDKKGRPYSWCQICGTRAFMHSRIALRGLQLFAGEVVKLWSNAATATQTMGMADKQVDNMIAGGELKPNENF